MRAAVPSLRQLMYTEYFLKDESQCWDVQTSGNENSWLKDLNKGRNGYVDPGTRMSPDDNLKVRVKLFVGKKSDSTIKYIKTENRDNPFFKDEMYVEIQAGSDPLDPNSFPAVPCPDCSGENHAVRDVTFTAGMDCTCIGTTSLTIGPNVVIEKNAKVTFKSPGIVVKSKVWKQKKGRLLRWAGRREWGTRIGVGAASAAQWGCGFFRGACCATEVAPTGVRIGVLRSECRKGYDYDSLGFEVRCRFLNLLRSNSSGLPLRCRDILNFRRIATSAHYPLLYDVMGPINGQVAYQNSEAISL
ncbi:MAG: hypothetical protein JRD04_05500 [Deltaproteobacteria bacterium]|nr:hypothetical protein [Deltaproteobacteria bacterium]